MKVQYGKEIEVRVETDVFVAGGGPAGAAAAIAAARTGRRVFLAEAAGAFGGAGTVGLVPVFQRIGDGVNELCAGIGKEIIDRAYEGGAKDHEYFAINKEALKRAYDGLISEAGVEFRFMTNLIDVAVKAGEVEYVVLSDKSGVYAVKAKVYIDCTGDGDLCAFAGAEFEKGDENGQIMPSTLCSYWADIDWDKFDMQYKHEQNIYVDDAYKKGILSVRDRHMPGITKVGATLGGGNLGHAYDVDASDSATVTRALLEQRRMLPEFENYFRTYWSGFEKARLISTAEFLGIRASRRITGEYILNIDDYMSRAVFDDEIGRYCYSVDIHPSKTDDESYQRFRNKFKGLWYKAGESYGIPYRILTPKGLKNVLTAGRCVSTDNAMQASIRVMPGCYITGQAAGTAAALCAEYDCSVQSLDIKKLQARLVKDGAYLPNFSE
ncbi:MAG: FAD-dependent oxidoreductase [Clostridiales bacterium]|jgi:ribulose 1,5-bisphosphate synthetase/thiazole synthase|nr:FAD-dependent oxidoreductase [Clostridiales bacterium]